MDYNPQTADFVYLLLHGDGNYINMN